MEAHYSLKRKFCFIIIVIPVIIFHFCGSKTPKIKLIKSDFSLNLQQAENFSPFEKVKSLTIDNKGNFYILDSEKLFIFKFDSLGDFVKLFGGEGKNCGQLSFPTSMEVYKDSLLVIHNRGSIDFLDLDGKCIKHILVRGWSDMSISPKGTIVLNRMSYSLELGFFIQTLDLNGKYINNFSPTFGKKYKNRNADLAFSGFTSDNHLVYVPAFLDSIYIFDLEGNILKRKQRVLPKSLTPNSNKPLVFSVEDVFVSNDRIFLLRVDEDKLSEKETYVREIEEYDLDLNLKRVFQLPESITMSIESIAFIPWYHKFIVKDDIFIFMVSKPVEHLVAYEPKRKY